MLVISTLTESRTNGAVKWAKKEASKRRGSEKLVPYVKRKCMVSERRFNRFLDWVFPCPFCPHSIQDLKPAFPKFPGN